MRTVFDGIIGLATGDALGVPVEFMERQEIAQNPVTSMREYGTHQQPKGTWSDDTSLTLALMDSIIAKNGIVYEDMMDRFSNWLMYGDYTASGEVFDVGNATSRAIMNYGRGRNPLECGGIAEYENGNGSLMRILPLVFYLQKYADNTMEEQMRIVHQVSSLTHRHPISLIGCGIYTNIAMHLLGQQVPLYSCVEQGILESFTYYENKKWDDIRAYERLQDLYEFQKLPEAEIKSSGFVVDTLEAALWSLLNTNTYKECVLKAVNLGEDTDTVGAVAGGLAGIYYGADGIPKEWLNVIVRRQYIQELCERMQRVFQ